MDIFTILSESRTPSNDSKPRHIYKPLQIMVEAEKEESDDNSEDNISEDETSEEYTNDNQENDNESDKENSDSTQDENNEETPEDDSLELPESEESEPSYDDTVSNDSGYSYGDNSEESPTDELDPDKTKSVALLDDVMTLYYTIKRLVDRMNNMSTHGTMLTIKAFSEAKDNFIKLSDLLYDFITKRYNTNTYVKNLYVFNYFIQSYKINVDILEKTIKSETN